MLLKQGVALDGRNRTELSAVRQPTRPAWRRPTAHALAALQTTTTDASEQNSGTLGGRASNKEIQ